MKRFLTAMAGLGSVLLFSARAWAQIANPTFANLYWERSGHTWEGDIASYASGSGSGVFEAAFMTRDMIDSLLQSALSSQWIGPWAPYGVTAVNSVPLSVVVVPDANSNVPACVGVTPSSMLLDDWDANIPQFINCAVALNPQLAPSNVVLNIFFPPWVQGTDSTNDWCIHNGWCGYNDSQSGHRITHLPTESNCEGPGFPQLGWCLSHEITETTVGQANAADVCERSDQRTLHLFDYSANKFNLTTYEQQGLYVSYVDGGPPSDGFVAICVDSSGVQQPCVCIPSVDPTSPGDATIKVCGAGQNMVIQAQLDQSGGFNPPPWDLPTLGNGFGGSLYVGAQVQSVNVLPWTAGLGHLADGTTPALVETGPLTWTTSGFVQINGFTTGYGGSSRAHPGDSVTALLYDTAWAQPNLSAPNTLPAAPAEYPNAFVSPGAYCSALGGCSITARLVGSNNCGLPGHQLSPQPIGEAMVTLTSTAPDQRTNERGQFSIGRQPSRRRRAVFPAG